MDRLDCAPGMGERSPETLLIGRVASSPDVIDTPSGITVTMLSLAVCGDTYELVTFGTEAERAAELVLGQVVCAEGRWQVRQEGRRELAVSVFRVLSSAPEADLPQCPEHKRDMTRVEWGWACPAAGCRWKCWYRGLDQWETFEDRYPEPAPWDRAGQGVGAMIGPECAMVGCGQPAARTPLVVDLASLPGPIEVPLCALCRAPFAEGFEDLAELVELDGADEITARESAA